MRLESAAGRLARGRVVGIRWSEYTTRWVETPETVHINHLNHLGMLDNPIDMWEGKYLYQDNVTNLVTFLISQSYVTKLTKGTIQMPTYESKRFQIVPSITLVRSSSSLPSTPNGWGTR